MKIITFSSIIIILLLQACEKPTDSLRPLSNLTVAHAAINIATAKVYASENVIPWKSLPATDIVVFSKAANFAAFTGNNYIMAVSGADTSINLFGNSKGTEMFSDAGFNTLFLCGQAGSYEGIFMDNDKIVNYTDSVVGIRFINLSPNSTPINIRLSTSPGATQADNLAYKQFTDFKTYPSGAANTSIIFQVRDAAVDTLMTTYTLPTTAVTTAPNVSMAYCRFKNITLVVKGLAKTNTGTHAFGIFPVAHY